MARKDLWEEIKDDIRRLKSRTAQGRGVLDCALIEQQEAVVNRLRSRSRSPLQPRHAASGILA
jgi:hypothetical protein